MPMAVNVDQDTLFFLKDFFQGFSSPEDDEAERTFGGKDRPIDDQPIFTVQPAREATEAEIQVNNRSIRVSSFRLIGILIVIIDKSFLGKANE